MVQRIVKSPVFLAYITVFGIMLVLYIALGVYPFGDSHILRIDEFHAFAPELNEFIYKLQNGESLFYSWRGGLGADYYFVFILEMLNPFVLLGLIFGSEGITETFALIQIIEIPAIAASCAYFLMKKYNRKDITVVTFSVMYALSSFVTAFFWVYYWLPPLAVLPFVALGLDRLIKTGGFKMYAISLGIGIITNFHFGLFLCYFSVFYFIIESVTIGKTAFSLPKLLKYAVSSLAGAAIGAVSLVPSIVNVGNTAYSNAGAEVPGFEIFYSIPQTLTAMLHGAAASVTNGVDNGTPNIYAGMLAILLAVLFLFHKNIPLRRKVAVFSILGFLLLTTEVSLLAWTLNGLRNPSGLPHRYMFIFVFFIVMAAFESYQEIKELSKSKMYIAFGIVFSFIILLYVLYPYPDFNNLLINGFVSTEGFLISLLLAVLFAALLTALHKKSHKRKKLKYISVPVLIFVLVVLEFVKSSYQNFSYKNSEPSRYLYANQIQADIAPVNEKLNSEAAFYRAEISPNRLFTDGKMFEFNGLSVFSVVYNSVTGFFSKAGIAGSTNKIEYRASDPLLNMMLGVKYTVNRGFMLENPSIYFEKAERFGALQMYENQKVLPVGFTVLNGIRELDISEKDPIEVKNALASAASGVSGRVYTDPVPSSGITGQSNVTAELSDNKYSYTYTANEGLSPDDTLSFEVNFTVTEEKPTFVTVAGINLENINVFINGTDFRKISLRNGTDMLSLGTLQPGDTVNAKLTLQNDLAEGRVENEETKEDNAKKNPLYLLGIFDQAEKEKTAVQSGSGDVLIYQLNEDVYSDVYGSLSASPLNVTSYDETHINGNINSTRDGTLFFSIPYDKRWHIYIDENEVPTFGLADTFLGVDLKEGSHTVRLEYKPEGIILSFAVSGAALAGVLLASFIYRRKKTQEGEAK